MKNWIQWTAASMILLGSMATTVFGQARSPIPARPVGYAHSNGPVETNGMGSDAMVWADTGYVVNSTGDWSRLGNSAMGSQDAYNTSCGCQSSATGMAAGGCGHCSSQSAFNSPVLVSPLPQPTGVTSGNCQPCISAVDCVNPTTGEGRWSDAVGVDFQPLLHGEHIGPVRLPSMLEYRVRTNDEVTFTYIPTRQRSTQDYRLMVGDTIQVSSISEASLRREKIVVQPDGKIYLPALKEPVVAYGKTIQQLRVELETAYKGYFKIPAIDIEPTEVNRALLDLLDSVNGPFAAGGRAFSTVVNPDGRVQLPVLGGVYILGMTLDEIKREVNLRYQGKVTGIEVEPRLTRMAPHFFHVYGQVATPGRYEMLGPTTVTAGLAQAGGISLGGNGRQVIIFRRADDWRLVSTVLDLRGTHLGKRPNPSDEIWLRDSDLIIVPERPITRANQAIQQIFTDGIYRVIPFSIQN